MQLKSHLWSFGFKGLPSDQHFTFAKNSNSGINFHLTKNIHDPEYPKKKPAIPILELDKEIIDSDINSLFLKMFFGMLNEINIEEIKNKAKLTFLSFDDLKYDDNYQETQKDLFKKFEDISKITKKTRLKVSGEWTDRLVSITESEKMLDLINRNTNDFNNVNLKDIDGGILVSEGNILSVIKIYEKWYELSTNKKPIEMFKTVLDEKIANFLWYNIRRSIVILKSVNTWRQTENYYRPVKLTLIEEKPDGNNVYKK